MFAIFAAGSAAAASTVCMVCDLSYKLNVHEPIHTKYVYINVYDAQLGTKIRAYYLSKLRKSSIHNEIAVSITHQISS